MYFITTCTYDRLTLFGEIVDGEMIQNGAGIMVQKCWHAIPDHFPRAMLGEFVVMPNHFHGIIIVDKNRVGANNDLPAGANVVGAKNLLPNNDLPMGAKNHLSLQSNAIPQLKHGTSGTIGSIVRGFKIGVTKWFRANTDVHVVWQRNYYEHIIRNDEAYLKIAEYIKTNPQKWSEDTYYV